LSSQILFEKAERSEAKSAMRQAKLLVKNKNMAFNG
jgi:hypothetical protein